MLAESAEIFLIIGTSLTVYPAAGLVDISNAKRKVLVDPKPNAKGRANVEIIAESATEGVPRLVAELLG
jgi:NAD-dependent deacetylase